MSDLSEGAPTQPRTAISLSILDQRIVSRPILVLAGLVIIGTILRLLFLADKSIWLDEAFSVFLSQQTLGDLFRLVVRSDAHPPLYYLLLKLWLLSSDSAGHVRLFSAIFSIAAIPLMYLVVSSLFDDVLAGLIGAGILAFSPLHIWYAQEARMYALLIFFVLASAAFFIRALQNGSPKDWIGYALTTTLALYTDYAAIWYFLGISVFYLLSWKRFPNRSKGWMLSQAAILIAFSPWLRAFLEQTEQVTESFWLSSPTFQTVLGVFLDFNSLNFPWIAISILYMTVIFVWAYIVPDNSWQHRLVTVWLFVPVVISVILSLRQPIFLTRNLIVASIGYYILVVAAIRRFKSARLMALLLLPLFVMNLISIRHNIWNEEKENWRDLAAHMAAIARNTRGGLIIFNPPYAELPFDFYFRQYDLDLDTQGYPEDEILLHPEPKRVGNLTNLLANRPYVWLVMRNDEAADPNSRVKEWLDSNGYVRRGDFYRDNITVLGYTRWDILVDRPPRTEPPDKVTTGATLYIPVLFQEIVEEPQSTEYTVQAGDTLASVARRYSTTVEALANANGIVNPDRIQVGQVLIIP
jgi:mannosyltransferase